jgi:hypothetical protein
MTCSRCGGMMNPEEFSNMTEGAVPWFYAGWRCLYCGDVVDSLILRHRSVGSGGSRGRQLSEPSEHPRPRGRRWVVRAAMAHGKT